MSKRVQRDDLDAPPFTEDVQIDEAMWCHKNNTWYREPIPLRISKIKRQVWVFGIVGEVTGRAKLFVVDVRNAQRLGPIVATQIVGGRDYVVNTDGWGAYEAIDWAGLGLIRVKHIHANNLERRTMEHSNLIEGIWGQIKQHTKRMYCSISGSKDLEHYLFEAKWRRDMALFVPTERFLLHFSQFLLRTLVVNQ